MEYLEQLLASLWAYKTQRFAGQDGLFEEALPRRMRPPVFVRAEALKNVLVDPSLSIAQQRSVRSAIPVAERHRWFRSMKSSQALAQSVFGNLHVLGKLHVVAGVTTEDGRRPFDGFSSDHHNLQLEFRVNHLGEPRPTSVDVLVAGPVRVAIECKLTEQDIGHCSRPRLHSDEPEHCNGNLELQHGRPVPCSLTHIGVRYWDFVPRLFDWNTSSLPTPCPLHRTYQLVRNVLAACTASDANDEGYAVLLHDERNPAFSPGGRGYSAFEQVKRSLRNPMRLTRMSWQSLLAAMREDAGLRWLTEELHLKYGL